MRTRQASTRWRTAAPIAVALAACGPLDPTRVPRVGPETGDAAVVSASLSSISAAVFAPRCAPCHSGNPPLDSPALDPGLAFDALVWQRSSEDRSLYLVEPLLPEQSYLFLKVRGDASAGSPMPLDGDPLDPSDLAAIEGWILNGAPND